MDDWGNDPVLNHTCGDKLVHGCDPLGGFCKDTGSWASKVCHTHVNLACVTLCEVTTCALVSPMAVIQISASANPFPLVMCVCVWKSSMPPLDSAHFRRLAPRLLAPPTWH